MKKTLLILTCILCGIISFQAQNKMSVAGKGSSETSFSQSNSSISDNDNTPKFTLTGKVLTVKNLDNGSQIDIYSVLGAKVYSFIFKGNAETLNLNKGIYIVRVGKFTQKIIL